MAAAKHGTQVNAGHARRPATAFEAEVARLRLDLAEMKTEPDLLHDGALCQGVAARHPLMHTSQQHLPMVLMSRVFEVSKSGYCAWLKRALSKRGQDNARLKGGINGPKAGTNHSVRRSQGAMKMSVVGRRSRCPQSPIMCSYRRKDHVD